MANARVPGRRCCSRSSCGRLAPGLVGLVLLARRGDHAALWAAAYLGWALLWVLFSAHHALSWAVPRVPTGAASTWFATWAVGPRPPARPTGGPAGPAPRALLLVGVGAQRPVRHHRGGVFVEPVGDLAHRARARVHGLVSNSLFLGGLLVGRGVALLGNLAGRHVSRRLVLAVGVIPFAMAVVNLTGSRVALVGGAALAVAGAVAGSCRVGSMLGCCPAASVAGARWCWASCSRCRCRTPSPRGHPRLGETSTPVERLPEPGHHVARLGVEAAVDRPPWRGWGPGRFPPRPRRPRTTAEFVQRPRGPTGAVLRRGQPGGGAPGRPPAWAWCCWAGSPWPWVPPKPGAPLAWFGGGIALDLAVQPRVGVHRRGGAARPRCLLGRCLGRSVWSDEADEVDEVDRLAVAGRTPLGAVLAAAGLVAGVTPGARRCPPGPGASPTATRVATVRPGRGPASPARMPRGHRDPGRGARSHGLDDDPSAANPSSGGGHLAAGRRPRPHPARTGGCGWAPPASSPTAPVPRPSASSGPLGRLPPRPHPPQPVVPSRPCSGLPGGPRGPRSEATQGRGGPPHRPAVRGRRLPPPRPPIPDRRGRPGPGRRPRQGCGHRLPSWPAADGGHQQHGFTISELLLVVSSWSACLPPLAYSAARGIRGETATERPPETQLRTLKMAAAQVPGPPREVLPVWGQAHTGGRAAGWTRPTRGAVLDLSWSEGDAASPTFSAGRQRTVA